MADKRLENSKKELKALGLPISKVWWEANPPTDLIMQFEFEGPLTDEQLVAFEKYLNKIDRLNRGVLGEALNGN